MAALSLSEERALIQRCVEGDTRAFVRLVQAHQARVRSYIGSYLDWPDVVDDIAQEVFATAFADIRSYREAPAFSAWLLGIARHRVLRHLRSELRRSRALDRLLDSERVALVLADGERLADEERAIAALQRCIASLPPATADIVTQRYVQASSIGEIARRLNRAEGALRIALFRIRRALRDCVARRLTGEGTA